MLCPNHSEGSLREVLLLKRPDPDKEKWDGKMLTEMYAKMVSGVQNIRWIEEFDAILPQLMVQSETVYLNSNEYPKFYSLIETENHRKSLWIRNKYPLHTYKRLQPLLVSQRLIKSEVEIQAIRESCKITSEAFLKALKAIKPGKYEYEIEAEIIAEFLRRGADGYAYQPIIASGKNALILHYVSNNSICEAGELLLMDFGAEYGNYSSDCTRTVPVGGRFSPRQRSVYESVLKVFKAAKAVYLPGTTIQEINSHVNQLISRELISLGLMEDEALGTDLEKQALARYYYHGAAHFMGLDVHDPGGKDVILKKGMVLTCEPGIYIPEEGIGVRIENDILVGSNPIDLMEEIPIEVDEIENLMNQ